MPFPPLHDRGRNYHQQSLVRLQDTKLPVSRSRAHVGVSLGEYLVVLLERNRKKDPLLIHTGYPTVIRIKGMFSSYITDVFFHVSTRTIRGCRAIAMASPHKHLISFGYHNYRLSTCYYKLLCMYVTLCQINYIFNSMQIGVFSLYVGLCLRGEMF